MRRVLAAMILLLFIQHFCHAQRVDIYHIGIGQGDCTLIVAEDYINATETRKLTVLIDTGPRVARRHNRGDALWRVITEYLGPNVGIDYFIISHLHIDHLGVAQQLFERIYDSDNNGSHRRLTIIDRLANRPVNVTGPDGPLYGLWHYPARGTERYRDNRSVIAQYDHFVRINYQGHRRLVRLRDNLFGADYQEQPFLNIRFNCVATNGAIDWSTNTPPPNSPTRPRAALNSHAVIQGFSMTGYTPPAQGLRMPRSDNDLCYVFLLRLDGFRYLTGGDLSGEETPNPNTGLPSYTDMETPLVRFFEETNNGGLGIVRNQMHICCLKVSHHGSSGSTNPEFVQSTNPTLAIISAGMRRFRSRRHPHDIVVQRLAGYPLATAGFTRVPSASVMFTFTTDRDPAYPYLLTTANTPVANYIPYQPVTQQRRIVHAQDIRVSVARPAKDVLVPTPIQMQVSTLRRNPVLLTRITPGEDWTTPTAVSCGTRPHAAIPLPN